MIKQRKTSKSGLALPNRPVVVCRGGAKAATQKWVAIAFFSFADIWGALRRILQGATHPSEPAKDR